MFNLQNRRYTGAKTALLNEIKNAINPNKNNLNFLDIFAGTGVVGEYFIKQDNFKSLILNDFLDSNFAIYQGFFLQSKFDIEKLKHYKNNFNAINPNALESNYYSLEFGDKFFSLNDAKKIGSIRDKIDNLKDINQKEFYILLASLLYSCDKIANTVGHYDAYRKSTTPKDKFEFKLINPLILDKDIQIFKNDSNMFVENLIENDVNIDIAFIDPPYNSRQYSRFYHLLENLATNKKPTLSGIARKPSPENMSEYCGVRAVLAFKDLINNLAKCSKNIIVTYNNTYCSKSNSSKNKITFNQINEILNNIGTTNIKEISHKPFNSGKTDTKGVFKEHKEYIFVCKI